MTVKIVAVQFCVEAFVWLVTLSKVKEQFKVVDASSVAVKLKMTVALEELNLTAGAFNVRIAGTMSPTINEVVSLLFTLLEVSLAMMVTLYVPIAPVVVKVAL